MIDFKFAKEQAFQDLSKIESVSIILDSDKKKKLGFIESSEVWEVNDTEVEGNDGKIEIVKLHIVLDSDFPLSIPIIFLSPEDYRRLNCLPHVNSMRQVCTYDNETTRTVPTKSGQILKESISKAKTIISDGIAKKNTNDFFTEFVAYWEIETVINNKTAFNTLSLLESEPIDNIIKVICLENKIQQFEYILHSNSLLATRIKNFLKERSYKFKEIDCFYVGELTTLTTPPFDITNSKAVQLIKEAVPDLYEKYKSFINSITETKVVIFKKNVSSKDVFLGWIHKNLVNKKKTKGFRDGYYKKFHALTIHQAKENVIRISPISLTQNRLQLRTSGMINNIEKEYKFCIAGLGSVGSNLVHYLNSLGFPEFRLIDEQELVIENIQRHLLGFNYVGLHKTISLRHHLLNLNPTQEVTTREKSIVHVYNNELEYINQVDYLFITIGKSNIDNWISECQFVGLIKVPIFIIWVEPYLVGAHCIYLHPSKKGKSYKDFFNENGLYKFNIIENEEYVTDNKLLKLKEAGCQSTYIPYSCANLIMFIGQLFPEISNTITNQIEENCAWTWIGNKNVLEELNIKISNFGKNNTQGKLIPISK